MRSLYTLPNLISLTLVDVKDESKDEETGLSPVSETMIRQTSQGHFYKQLCPSSRKKKAQHNLSNYVLCVFVSGQK